MYQIVLFIHSWIRWFILLLGVVVIIRSLWGWGNKHEYKNSDNLMSVVLVGLFDAQLVLGLLLYLVLSPVTAAVFMNFGKAMNNPELRFWGVEHIFVMILAVAVAHLGRVFSKKAKSGEVKFRIQSIYFLLAFIRCYAQDSMARIGKTFQGNHSLKEAG